MEVQPEFELPQLEGIALEKPKIEITDQDVSEQVDRMRSMRGTYEPVEQGGIEQDDLVIADVKMTVGAEVIKQEENVRLAARPQRVDNIAVEKLGEVLAGAGVGDTRTVEAEVPQEYERPELAGKTATFELTVHDIKRLVLPTLDQELLSALGFDSEEELRDGVRRDMEARLDETIRRGMRAQVFQYLLGEIKLDLPAGLSQRQTERVVARRMLELRREGVPEAEIEKRLDELRTSASDQAAADLKLFFIMEKIAEVLKVEASEEEVNGQIGLIARQYNRRFDRVRDELAQSGMLNQLYLQIRDDKIVDHLLEKAEVTDKEVPQEAPAKAKKAPARARKAPARAKKAPAKTTKARAKAKKTPAKAKKAPAKRRKTRGKGTGGGEYDEDT